MIETILTTLTLKGGATLLRAAVEDRDLERSDAAGVITSLLEAVVAGQQQADASLSRIEGKLDDLALNPYHAAMTAGGRLLQDAAPAHRRPEDRRVMLGDARQAFAEAVGYGRDHPVLAARAEVMSGLTWLALGSPEDLRVSLNRATRLLQHEVLLSFQLSCQQSRQWEQRQESTSSKLRQALLGGSGPMPDWTGSDRFYRATDEHEAVWMLRVHTEQSYGPYPLLRRPHGSAYSHPSPGLPVQAMSGKTIQLADVEITMGPRDVLVSNRTGATVRVAMTESHLDPDSGISPDVSALDRGATFFRPGDTGRVVYDGPGKHPAACLAWGAAEGVTPAALVHGRFLGSSMMGPRGLL